MNRRQTRVLLVVALLGLSGPWSSMAQYSRSAPRPRSRGVPSHNSVRILCRCYTGTPTRSLSFSQLQAASGDYQRAVTDMARKVGITKFHAVYAGPVENAVAAVIGDKPVIIYNPQFLAKVAQEAGAWAPFSVLAHELGHHLNSDAGHEPGEDGPHSAELRADHWSGFVFRRLGASEQDATAAMQMEGSETDTSSHPSKYKRIQEIVNGYRSADANEGRGPTGGGLDPGGLAGPEPIPDGTIPGGPGNGRFPAPPRGGDMGTIPGPGSLYPDSMTPRYPDPNTRRYPGGTMPGPSPGPGTVYPEPGRFPAPYPPGLSGPPPAAPGPYPGAMPPPFPPMLPGGFPGMMPPPFPLGPDPFSGLMPPPFPMTMPGRPLW